MENLDDFSLDEEIPVFENPLEILPDHIVDEILNFGVDQVNLEKVQNYHGCEFSFQQNFEKFELSGL
jgi:hypothetical protein